MHITFKLCHFPALAYRFSIWELSSSSFIYSLEKSIFYLDYTASPESCLSNWPENREPREDIPISTPIQNI